MKNLMFMAMTVALMVVGQAAQAIVVITDGTVIMAGTNSYSGVNATTGLPDPSFQLTIAYDVTENTGPKPYDTCYTYDYTLTTTPEEDLTSFTIGGNADPIDTQTIGYFPFIYGQAICSVSGFNDNSVGWDWGFNSDVTTDTVGFSSELPPTMASYTANDDGIDWSSPKLIPAPDPAPAPEPSSYALLAGAVLMVGFLKIAGPRNGDS
jgi:hypothetical protein